MENEIREIIKMYLNGNISGARNKFKMKNPNIGNNEVYTYYQMNFEVTGDDLSLFVDRMTRE